MYRQMIGSLKYLTNTRPDICFAVSTLRHVHLMVAKHVVRYLKGTDEYGIKCISWFGRMESCMALSIAEAKDVATCYLGGSMFILKIII